MSGKPEEYEFLLNRGTDFLVTDIGQDGADTIIRMKVTGRTETEWSYATKEEVIEQWKRRGVTAKKAQNFYDERGISQRLWFRDEQVSMYSRSADRK